MSAGPTIPLRAVLVLAMAALAAGGCEKREVPSDPIRPVLLAQVVPGTGMRSAVFPGEVKARYESDLAFRVGGKIVSRAVDVGARVRRGEVLARLDPADLDLKTQAADAELSAAQVDYELAKTELDRYEGLLKQRFVSASAVDAKRNAVKAGLARVEQAKANLDVTRNQAAYAVLTAPEDGVVTSVAAEAGQVVAAGQVAMRYAREGEREVAIAVPEARIGELARAREIGVILVADPERRYRGRVREISPAVDPATRTFAVRVSVLDPGPSLQWGMTANVVLGDPGEASASLLPSPALYQDPAGSPAVWVYDPAAGQIALRPVEIAQYREDGVAIASGLEAGEWVVAAGANKLHEGQRVRPYEGPGRPAPPVAAAEPKTPAPATGHP